MLIPKFFSALAPHAAAALRHGYPHLFLELAGAAIAIGLLTSLILHAVRPSAVELERKRREQLTSTGRITTGELLEARTLEGEESRSNVPQVLLYSYRLAGVTYSCAQDVSALPERVRGFSIEGPVQVRYDPHNPCNSVLVSESWSGLWLTGQHG